MARPSLTVATVCGGSMVLALAGLIAGRPATTHHLGMDLLAANGSVAVDARVVDDGDLVTGATVTSGLDLALYLLERELGSRVAIGAEKLIGHERRGTVWRA
jgi:transcriptional regulator GlxA family with amidase domain